MKKFLAIILVLAAMLSLAACGKRHSIPDELISGTTPASSPVPTAVPVPTAAPTPVPTIAPTPVPAAPTPVPVVRPTAAPTIAPRPTPVPTPMPTANPYLKITKDPTGEVVDEGGKAYFVARAENYSAITWIISNSAGNMIYQDGAAASVFPGLVISGLGTETLCLDNIPYELSGWRVQAQFSGVGGPLSTAYAYITVNKVSETYDSLLNKYRQVVAGQDASQYGFTYLCNLDRNLGYCMQDIDNNGVFELLVGSLYGDGMIFEAYTLVNGTPVLLFQSSERDRYYLSTSASFYRHGSNSASSGQDTLYSYSGTYLNPIECVWSDDTYSPAEPEFYHCYGDRYSGTGERIDSVQYSQYVDNMAYSTATPSFIPIQ